MAEIEIPYLVKRVDKAGRLIGYYWQPNKAVRALGYKFEALKKDPVKAARRAIDLNAQVERSRAEGTSLPAAPSRVITAGSFSALIREYRGSTDGATVEPSAEWQDLAPKTQKSYTAILDALDAAFGDLPVSREGPGGKIIETMTPERITDLRDSMRDRPYMANYFMRVLSILMGFAMARPSKYGRILANPVKAVKKFGVKAGVAPRREYWDADVETAFMVAAWCVYDEMAIGFALLIYTGQRLSDVLKMEVKDYDGERIFVVQEKTGARVWIRAHIGLRTLLDAHLAKRHASGRIGGTILQAARGGAFAARWFSSCWDEVYTFAGILVPFVERLQRRDLRRTAVVRLAEAGCTPLEIAAITGHSIKTVESILEVYFVRTVEMADNAILKLEDYQARKVAGAAGGDVPPESQVP